MASAGAGLLQRGDDAAGALFSADGQHRYLLWRRWDTRPAAAFILLNPSIATEHVSDPTLRRCVGFARDWGYGAVLLANLFAFRSTDPRALARAPDPIGPGNDAVLVTHAAKAEIVVCGWGARGAGPREAAVLDLLAGVPLHALALTRGGQPRHPLYLRATSTPFPWPAGLPYSFTRARNCSTVRPIPSISVRSVPAVTSRVLGIDRLRETPGFL